MEKIYRVQMNSKGMPDFSTAVEIENIPIYGNEHNCIMTIFGECSYAETGCGDCAVVEKVRKALSADRPQEWIPCSERLPKKEEATYLICTEDGYMCSCRWTNHMYGLRSNEWSKWGWHIMDKPQYAKVVAWMPLKPWKGANDEKSV